MGNCKMIFILVLFCVLICSCDNKNTSKSYDEYQRILSQIQNDREIANENYAEAQKLIDTIFESLHSISGRTSALERSINESSNYNNLNKAEEIAKDIDAIKEIIKKSEEENTFDSWTQDLISKLKISLEQKENEINELKEIIQQKDQQMSILGEKLDQTNEQLNQSNTENTVLKDELRKSEIDKWISTGDELLQAARTIPLVKGHGSKLLKNIKTAKLRIIAMARNCYQRAENLGYSPARNMYYEAENYYTRVSDNLE